MRFLRTNTATIVTVGPFLSVSDGVTPLTSLTVTGCHAMIVVESGADATQTTILDADLSGTGNNAMLHITNDDAGLYTLALSATNTNYVGRMFVSIFDTDVHLPVFHEFQILSAATYDAWFGTGVAPANVTQFGGTNLTASSGIPAVNATQVGGTSQTGRDLGASVLLSSGTGTGQISLSSGTVTVGTNNDKTGYTASTVSDKTGYALADSTSDAVIADAVWNAATASYGSADTYGALVESGNVGGGAIVAASVTGAVGSVTGNVGGNVTGSVASVTGAVGSVTGNVGGNVTGSVGSVTGLTTATIADAVCDEAINTGHSTANTLAKIIYDNVNAPIATVDTVVDGIATTIGSAGAGLTSVGIGTNGIAAASIATGAITAAKFYAGAIDAAALAADAGAEIADAVWDEARSGHTTVGTYGHNYTLTVGASGNTTTQFTSNRAEANDYWIGAMVVVTSGALIGQVKEIGDYASSSGTFTLKTGEAFTAAPSSGDTMAIINR